MQVFIIGTPLETAHTLDARRLNKQIIECRQILDAIEGRSQAWKNHPCVLQYQQHKEWLRLYYNCLKSYRKKGFYACAKYSSRLALAYTPDFHTKEYFDQMKRRLYTKDPQRYAQWAHLGTSEVNWYFVDGTWLHYKNGKLIKQ